MTSNTLMRRALCTVLLVVAAWRPAAAAPIFRIESGEFWLNLHHFLYVLGRAEAKTGDSAREAVRGAPADAARGLEGLSEDERNAWREAVHAYAIDISLKDAVADDPLPALTSALAAAHDAAALPATAIDPATKGILERAAPLYRRAWWPAHRAANQRWQAAMEALVDRHGAAVLGIITRAYGMPWPESGYPVHVSAYANWAGAYSTTGDLLVVASLAPGNGGTQGLEGLFHEGMHQWDAAVFTLLREQAATIGRRVPRNLSHAMIFFTAGDAVRRVVDGHVPYAEVSGVWARGMESLRDALAETWKPYLDGRGTRDQALAALVAKATAAPRP